MWLMRECFSSIAWVVSESKTKARIIFNARAILLLNGRGVIFQPQWSTPAKKIEKSMSLFEVEEEDAHYIALLIYFQNDGMIFVKRSFLFKIVENESSFTAILCRHVSERVCNAKLQSTWPRSPRSTRGASLSLDHIALRIAMESTVFALASCYLATSKRSKVIIRRRRTRCRPRCILSPHTIFGRRRDAASCRSIDDEEKTSWYSN